MKKKSVLLCAAALSISCALIAQNNINEVLASIEANNTALKASRENTEARKAGNSTGIYLPGPEAEFNYLWGSPSGIGNRKDFSIKQTFDFPTLTGMKSRLAGKKNQLAEMQYQSDRLNILLEAKQYCIALIYCNALEKEFAARLEHARTLADAYKKRLDLGDANALEYNKVLLNLSSVQGEISKIEVERNALLSELKRMNGGISISLEAGEYAENLLPADFEAWYLSAEQKSPLLQAINKQLEISKNEVKLNKAMGLPSISAGYMSENTFGQKYQGISIGISIPLWENKNRVKHAKANVAAVQAMQKESEQQLYDKLRNLYFRAKGLKQVADGYSHALAQLNNTELLAKALNAGEISLLDYILELGLYYDALNQALSAKRDFEKALAELTAVEL